MIDGQTGLLVPPGDPAALAGALQQFYDAPSLCAQYGSAARLHVQSRFTEDAMADHYETLFFGHSSRP